jgi:potassium voltage-gated channel Eag-related subfamily H protein 8
MLDLMNNSWKTVDLPSIWKLASVIPIPRPGIYHSEPSNYRPIALTSCAYKTLERIINNQLLSTIQFLINIYYQKCFGNFQSLHT